MGKTNDEIIKYIKEFRDEFRSWPDWEKGNPKQVNALTYYEETFNKSNDLNEFMYLNKMLINAKSEKEKEELKNKMEKFKKKGLPGHVQASINYNILREQNHDYYSMPIYDGSKIIVCKLKKNPLNMKSIAYPVDETRLPDWFKNLPFDAEQMERDQIDTKLKNIFGKLNIDLEESKNMNMFDELFS